jgi:hypothetical protein
MQNHLLQVHNELVELLPSIKWIGGDRKLILIGDVLSDRGPCDLLTLKIIEHLTKDRHDDRFIRLASNHDHNVVPWLAGGKTQISSDQSCSLDRAEMLAAYINQKDENRQELTKLRELYKDYLNQSKLLHYDPATKTLYTHAAVTNKNLDKLVKVLKETDSSIPKRSKIQDGEAISAFVNKANKYYTKYVNKWIEQKYNENPGFENVLAGDPKKAFLWNRSALSSRGELPLKGQGVSRLVHGHDSRSKRSSYGTNSSSSYHIVNLDQDIRKDHPSFFDPLQPNPLYAEFPEAIQTQ